MSIMNIASAIRAMSAAAAGRAAAAHLYLTSSVEDVLPEIPDEASTIMEAIEDMDISREDLTFSNFIKGLKLIWPYLRSLALNLLAAFAIYFIGKRVINLLLKMLEKFLKRTQVDDGASHFIVSVLGIILRILLIFITLGQLGINTASILAMMGAAGLAIAMSLQSSLSNVAGGIVILFMKPFKVGDFISTSHGDGTVTQIGMVYTALTMPDNRVLTIPNGELSNSAVTDVTMLEERRLDLSIGISYKSDILKAKKLMEEIFESCPGRVEGKPVNVHVSSLSDSAVIMEIFGYVETPMYLTAKWFMNEQLKLRFDEAGIEIPYPQMDVHVDSAGPSDHITKMQ